MRTSTALLVGLLLLAANGLFVAAEFALLAARRAKVEALAAEGSRAARSALAGVRELSLMLAGAQLGITMASLGLGAVAEPAIHRSLDNLLAATALPRPVSLVVSLVLALGITVFLHMVVGEMAPKTWAISKPETAVLLLAPPFRLFVRVLRPGIALLNWLSNLVVRSCGVEPRNELAYAHSPTDLVLLLRESADLGTLDSEQQTLMTRAIDLSGLDAEAVMIPRQDVVAVPVDAGIGEIEQLASTSGRSRIPVYEGDLDRYLGVLHVKDLLDVAASDREMVRAANLARPAMAAPESRPLEDLMLDMRSQRQHVALVVDEYGSVVGLVTLDDVLEELIGEFEDESDRHMAVTRRADGALLVPGSLRRHEAAQLLDVELPEGEWETLGGLLMAMLERMPEVGDRVETDEVSLEVTRMDRHRVQELAIRAR